MDKISNIILDDHAVALNDLLVACRRSLNHFSRAAKLLEADNAAEWFDTLRHRRQPTCDRVKDIMLELNYLPKGPDPDKEMVVGLATHVKVILADDEKTTLLRKAGQMQLELEKHLDVALRLKWPACINERLNHIKSDLQADKARIEKAVAQPS